jgi:2-desacetyl-2-hydroxyethyl bacteriochlorophyllide A dehydrogenase
MKALVYTAVRKLEWQDWPDPQLSPGEALVRVGAVGVCGSDIHGWTGHSRGRVPPLVLGHEMSGIVEGVEGNGGRVKAGDLVAIFPLIGCGQCAYCAAGRDPLCRRRLLLGMHLPGGFAEYLKAPVRSLYPIPADLGFVQGALIEPLANALHFVESAKADRGPIAILGAGPIGFLMLQTARQKQFPRIAVVEINPNRAGAARAHGADLVVNPQDPDAIERLQAFFGEDGCSAVLDAAGFAATRELAVKLVRSGGLIVLAGLGSAEGGIDFVEVTRREIRLAGVYGYTRSDFERAISWVTEGRLDLADWVREARLAEGQAVFEDLARPDSSSVKVVLKP